mmetsp:Transcript_44481/g.71286  ORF Transcript_44481/g.71286 Transcript_44481/m.71286 type:complete len:98 (+) Transcript_44481:140-433(+)
MSNVFTIVQAERNETASQEKAYEHEEAAHDPGEGAGVILQHRQHQTPTVGALRADWPLLEGVGGPTPGLRDNCFSVSFTTHVFTLIPPSALFCYMHV